MAVRLLWPEGVNAFDEVGVRFAGKLDSVHTESGGCVSAAGRILPRTDHCRIVDDRYCDTSTGERIHLDGAELQLRILDEALPQIRAALDGGNHRTIIARACGFSERAARRRSRGGAPRRSPLVLAAWAQLRASLLLDHVPAEVVLRTESRHPAMLTDSAAAEAIRRADPRLADFGRKTLCDAFAAAREAGSLGPCGLCRDAHELLIADGRDPVEIVLATRR
jgi:hypothetical protein